MEFLKIIWALTCRDFRRLSKSIPIFVVMLFVIAIGQLMELDKVEIYSIIAIISVTYGLILLQFQ